MSSLAPTTQGRSHQCRPSWRPSGPPATLQLRSRQIWVVVLHRALLAWSWQGLQASWSFRRRCTRPPVYQAVASVLVEPNQSKVIKDDPARGRPARRPGVVDTEVEVLKTRAVAERVADRLELYLDPEFNPAVPHGATARTYHPDRRTSTR